MERKELKLRVTRGHSRRFLLLARHTCDLMKEKIAATGHNVSVRPSAVDLCAKSAKFVTWRMTRHL